MNGTDPPPVPPAPAHLREALPRPDWMEFLDEEEWRGFSDVVTSAEAAGVEVLLGGALGMSAYMPLRRHTKDIDLYVMPEDRERIVALLSELGFEDLHDRLPYDRGWIYRSIRREVIVDIIWCFANRRAVVDERWFRHSRAISCADTVLRIVPPEELIWAKLFVVQRDRCDWPDLLNLLFYTGATLDWDRLAARLGPDRPLLDALLAVFGWLCPGRPVASELPCGEIRADLIDSRAWFLPMTHPTGHFAESNR